MGTFITGNLALPPYKIDATPPQGNPAELDAGDINFLRDAVGDLRDHTRGWINAQALGADPTGTNDSTAAIQTAITAAYGATLFFPPGTYKLTAALNIATTAGLTIRGRGATLATNQQIVFNFNGASSNVAFEGLKLSSSEVSASGFSGLITGIVAVPLVNIKVTDCEFTAPTSATNGIKFDLSNVASSLTGLEVTGCRFLSIGRMAVEIVNHTFDDLSRYEQIRIASNRFDTLGMATAFGQAVSLSGMGKSNVVTNNTMSNTKDIAIELVGAWTTTISLNTIRALPTGAIGISQGKPASASQKPQGLAFSGNVIEGPTSGYAMQLTGMQDASIAGNVVTGTGKVSVETSDFVTLSGNAIDVTNQVLFLTCTHLTSSGNLYACRTNTVGFNPDIQSTTLSRFIGDEFLSERSTGLLVDGTSANNSFVGCTFSNEGSPAGGNCLQFNGASVIGNLVIAPRFRRTAAGGTTWAQVSTSGNQLGAGVTNTFNPDSVVAAMPLTLGTSTNAWLTPVQLGSAFIYSDSASTLRLKTSAPTADKDGTPVSQPPASTFANLGTPANGAVVFCTDAVSPSNPATGGGTGALCVRQAGIWKAL